MHASDTDIESKPEKCKEGLSKTNEEHSFAHRQMIKYQNRVHFRVGEEHSHKKGEPHTAHKHKRLPLCRPTGWLCCTKVDYGCCKSCRKEEPEEEKPTDGEQKAVVKDTNDVLGVNMYFRLLKSLTLLFFVFTLINIPMYILFFHGTNTDAIKDSKSFFATLTLGNLGQSNQKCATVLGNVPAIET